MRILSNPLIDGAQQAEDQNVLLPPLAFHSFWQDLFCPIIRKRASDPFNTFQNDLDADWIHGQVRATRKVVQTFCGYPLDIGWLHILSMYTSERATLRGCIDSSLFHNVESRLSEAVEECDIR